MHRLDRAPCRRLALYAKTSLPLRRLPESEDSRHEYLAFVARLKNRMLRLFFLYRSNSSDSEVFEVLSSEIDSLLQKYPAAKVSIFGDCNAHLTGNDLFILVAPTLKSGSPSICK